MERRTTIRDVARSLGVSHTTVAMALRNDPRILPATRRKVAQAAAKLGYRRDPVLSELMLQLRRAKVRPVETPLALLSAWPGSDSWRRWAGGHLLAFYEGARVRGAELGYGLEEFCLRERGMTPARMTSILQARGIRGVLVLPLPEPAGRVDLGWRHFAAVTKGLSVVHPVMHRVISSHYDDLRLALARLIRRGYRRIGLVLNEPASRRVAHAWMAGYYLHQHMALPEHWVPALLISGGAGESQFAEWHARHRPEAILFAHQPIFDWVARLGLKVPRDVGIVDLSWSREHPERTGIDIDPAAQGSAAIELLTGQLEAHEYGVPHRAKIVEVMGRWVAGKTIR
jgi:LacI family transcriptional regulator